MANNIVPMEQISMIVQGLKDFKLIDVGSQDWLVQHGHIVSLGQQAALEIAQKREEQVKEELMIHDKIKVLVNEVICARIWQQNVLPELLQIGVDPQMTGLISSIILNEAAGVAVLDMALYHENACETLGDATVDLIDYCAYKINDSLLIPEKTLPQIYSKPMGELSTVSEVEQQQFETSFKTSLRCISILHYLTINDSKIPSDCLRRIVDKIDVVDLMINVLKRKPWIRTAQNGNCQKFIDEKWQNVDEIEAIRTDKYAAQIFIFLRQVLLNRELMAYYEFTEHRCINFEECLEMLSDMVLDQLPTIIELKLMLTQAVRGMVYMGDKSDLMSNIVPHIFESFNKQLMKYGDTLPKLIGFRYFTPSEEKLPDLRNFLSKCDNSKAITEKEDVESKKEAHQLPQVQPSQSISEQTPQSNPNPASNSETISSCAICQKHTQLKCNNCSDVFYCSMTCQMQDWIVHKFYCRKF